MVKYSQKQSKDSQNSKKSPLLYQSSQVYQDCTNSVTIVYQQELSYRKQIARQLHTQYVEGIHRPKYYTVTLKSRLGPLKVTGNGTTGQIIHDLLLVELSDVKYYRDLAMWVRGHSSH